MTRPLLFVLLMILPGIGVEADPHLIGGKAWLRHTIDRSSRGADGARFRDADRNGDPDLVTPWEEGGEVRLYLHPGRKRVRRPWPAVTVGRPGAVEDAVMADLWAGGGGFPQVISSSEGSIRTLWVHWLRDGAGDRPLRPESWMTAPIPASRNLTAWMFALPMRVDDDRKVDLVCGSKGDNGVVGWFRAPDEPSRLEDWRWYPISPAGWIMSLESVDMDGDGDFDLLITDRYGDLNGCRWLEKPDFSSDLTRPWKSHPVGEPCTPMFLASADLTGDGCEEVLVAVKPQTLQVHLRRGPSGREWDTLTFPFPPGTGTAKGIACDDLDGDGSSEVVLSCEGAVDKEGVFAWKWDRSPHLRPSAAIRISGTAGTKFDLVALEDLDRDGDPDIITCEEREGLGVFWYENPSQTRSGEGSVSQESKPTR